MNNKISNYNNYSINSNEEISFNNDEKPLINFIKQLKQIFILKENSKGPDNFDKDDYSILLTGLMILLINNNKDFSFEVTGDFSKILIKIKKSIEYTDFQLFTTLFEELSLVNLRYINMENEWRLELFL